MFYCFFFSSRRRHTRYIGDWSSDVCSSDLVQVLLLGPIVLALALHLESQEIAIEAEARRRVAGDDRRVVDAEEQPAGRSLPLGVALPGRELQDLQHMAVRVLEVEGADAAGLGVPVGQALRLGRDVLGAMLSQAPVRPVDVAHDDRDVLERAVVAARVRRDRPATRRQVFRQLDRLLAQPETDDAHAEPEDALEALVVLARHLDVRDGLEPEDVGEEAYRAVHVRYGDPHGVDRPDERAPRPGRRRGREGEREEPGGEDGGAPHASRSRRWSPTRSAFAMMVSAGFTAQLEGKKLASTT